MASDSPPTPVVAIIPARLGSTRFPEKVLARRTGKPLIQHVHAAASRAKCISRVVIATDHQRVFDAVIAFGGECVMTSPDHPNGTSRLAEAARLLELPPNAIVVNVQGDEPEVETIVIESAVEALRANSQAQVATVAVPIGSPDEKANPNIVKVVLRQDGTALYFSRAAIPFVRDPGQAPGIAALRHVGLYVYRRPFLDRYAGLKPTDLERCESLEQLRVLEHGYSIAVAVVSAQTGFAGIDTPEQYEAFVRREQTRSGR
ncbi:MAG: 3-deoxy-manno-octulosonate cytidylyltransferase [Phycisphaerales bacterium]|nr:3-deoxy-manno-octulosonate cytidylyltransferase [Planctomycetota bacterium]